MSLGEGLWREGPMCQKNFLRQSSLEKSLEKFSKKICPKSFVWVCVFENFSKGLPKESCLWIFFFDHGTLLWTTLGSSLWVWLKSTPQYGVHPG